MRELEEGNEHVETFFSCLMLVIRLYVKDFFAVFGCCQIAVIGDFIDPWY
jgi:hypothetical protein